MYGYMMGMLELVVRFRLGRIGNFHTSSSLVAHKKWYIYIYIYPFFIHKKGGYSSIGRTTVCGIVSSLFNPGYPPC